MIYLKIIIFFIIGATIANIINRIIYRYYNDIPLFGIRSFCPKCQEFYKWYNALPVFGYIIQFGKCAYCHELLDPYRFIIELISGILYSFLYVKYNISFELFFSYLLIILILIVSTTLRIKNYISDFSILLFSIFITSYSINMIISGDESFNRHFLGFIISTLFMLIIKLILNNLYIIKNINFNHCVFISLFGFLLGLHGLIISLFIAALFGVAIELIYYNYRSENYKIPVLLYLIFGMSISYFFNQELLILFNL